MDSIVLRDALEEVLEDINDQIELLADLATSFTPPCKPSEVRDTHGNFMLNPLLIAKAQVLAAMAYQNTSPTNNTFVITGTASGQQSSPFPEDNPMFEIHLHATPES